MLYDAFSISENREVLIQYLLKLGYKINAWGALFEEGRKDRLAESTCHYESSSNNCPTEENKE